MIKPVVTTESTDMRIGTLAATCDCPAETIRYYEKIGLLPQAVRTIASKVERRISPMARVVSGSRPAGTPMTSETPSKRRFWMLHVPAKWAIRRPVLVLVK